MTLQAPASSTGGWRLRAAGALVALLLVPPARAPLVGQEPVRFDVVRVTPPAGWGRKVAEGALTFTSAAGDGRLVAATSQPLAGSVDDVIAQHLEQAGKRTDFRLVTPASRGRHPRSKGRWASCACSYRAASGGELAYEWVLALAAGGRCTTFTLTCDTVAAYNEHTQTWGAALNEVQTTTTMQLERGSPALTRHMVDETLAFVEWLLQAPFTDAQRGTIEGELRRFWREQDREEIDGVQELLAAREELAALPAANRELARQAVLEEALAGWRREPDGPGAKLMLQIHAETQAPIAEGDPPLVRQAADAFAEFLVFAAAQVAGVEHHSDDDTRTRLSAGVAEGYAELDAEHRTFIAGMPAAWAAIRALWPDLAEDQRRAYVDAWRKNAQVAELAKRMQAARAARQGALSKDFVEKHRLLQEGKARLFVMDFQWKQMQFQRASYSYRW